MVRVCRLIPPQWESYSPIGEIIPKTRFIVFKTPLNERLLTKVKKENRFSVNTLLRQIAEANQRLGLVIDLTDTTRYYDQKDVEGMCIEYEKINCPGRGFVDNDDAVTAFNNVIQKYTETSDDSEALIGIHCTDGINRSGYLVCRFLIEHLGWSSHEALEAFERARGYPIANGSYVQELHKAAKKTQEKARKEAEGGAEEMSESDSEGRQKKRKKNKRKREADEEDPNVENMMEQFLGEITQQAREIQDSVHSPMLSATNYVESPRQKHWAFQSKRQKIQDEKVKITTETRVEQSTSYEFEADQFEEEGDEEGYEEGQEEAEGLTKAQKRRIRKNRQQKMLSVMARGNFHEIREMQEEYMKSKGSQL